MTASLIFAAFAARVVTFLAPAQDRAELAFGSIDAASMKSSSTPIAVFGRANGINSLSRRNFASFIAC